MPRQRNDADKVTYLITSALPYANGDIHLGHVLEAVQTDIYVRYQKLRGNEALYVCADDTHGTPVELKALQQGITPQELVRQVGERHRQDYQGFDIGFDVFHTTDSPENRDYAERIFKGLQEHGLIVEREIEQFFCEHDRRFLPDRFITGSCPRCGAADQYGDVCESCGATYNPSELAQPQCRLCRKPPVMKKSTHLFVTLERCAQFLTGYLNGGAVLQEDMKNFVNNFIAEGLHDWCISRDGPYFGFPIPGYPGKFFYVWLDAPVGYISSTARWGADRGVAAEKYWGKGSPARVVHFIGKDIIYFHTLFWPVMLENAGFNLPWRYFVHGFLNTRGEKMSKTRGTFVLARDFLAKVAHPQAGEFLRFYFAAKLASNTGDIDFTPEDFCNRANTTLVNNIGNLHHRTFVFCERLFNRMIPDAPWDAEIEKQVADAAAQIAALYERGDMKSVVEIVHALGNGGNKYFQDRKPWELIKSRPDEAAAVMVTCANLVKALVVFLKPVLPRIAATVEKQLGTVLGWEDWAFSLRNVPAGETVKLTTPVEPAQLAPLFAPPPDAAPAPAPGLPQIDINDFAKVDLRVAEIAAAEKVAKSNKLVRLQVRLGAETRQVVAGIGQHYAPETLVGRQVVIVANLKPAMLMGQRSEGMVLAVQDGGALVLVQPEKPAAPGSKIS